MTSTITEADMIAKMGYALGSPTGGIHAAIAQVYSKVGYVQKTGQMTAGPARYSYAGERDFIEAIRPELVAAGIYMHVNRVREVKHEVLPTKNGTTNRVTLIGTVRFAHTDGSFIECEATGEGMDTGDKASGKAMTNMFKYALRQTFCIETGDDPDDTPSEEFRREQPKQERRPEPEQPREQKPAGNVDAWKKMTDLMKEEQVGKAHIEPVIGGFNANILNDWLAAEEGRTVQELIMLAVEKKQGK